MSLEHAILGLLNEHPRSGYDLKTRCFDETLRRFWSADQAQIYRTLDRLQATKSVTSRRRKQAGRPDRKLFEITQSGREILGRWLSDQHAIPAQRDPFLLQLYFGSHCPDELLVTLLAAQRAQHQTRLDDLRGLSAQLAAESHTSDRSSVLRQTAFDGAIARERASIDWLDECIEAAKDGVLPGSEDPGIGQRHLFGT